MSLLKRQKEKERKAAEDAARLAEEKKLRDLAVHPLVKDGSNRDVRDGYFYGLVFAAIADDDKIDKNEKSVLLDIGSSIGISSTEVNDAIERVASLSDDSKLSLIEECIATIKGSEIGVKLFYAQFVLLWTSHHEHDAGDLSEYLRRFSDKTGVDFPMAKRHAVIKVLEGEEGVDGALVALADWMGDEPLKYFVVKRYGDVSDILNRTRRARASAEKRRKEQSRIDAVRKEFHDRAMALSRQYGSLSYVPQEWAEKFNELFDEIDGADIDWVQECNSVLSALQEIGKGYVGKAIWRPDYQTRRKIAWRLLCMLFVHSGEIKIANDPCRWLRSISNISSEGFRKKVEKFLEENFDVTFVIPE